MCRNIRALFNFQPPATDEEIQDAALQFVRKISGFSRPSDANTESFNAAVQDVALASRRLLDGLVTQAAPKDRAVESARRRARSARRFSSQRT